MKLDTSKYKITLMTETVCPTCQEIQQIFTDNLIKYDNKCITHKVAGDPATNKEFGENRWAFHDLKTDFPDRVNNTPVMIVEHVDGKKEIFSAGIGYESAEEALELVKENYCI